MLCGFTDIMKPQDGNTAVSAPLNGYCYLCTTQEEHRQHLVSFDYTYNAFTTVFDNLLIIPLIQ